MSRDLEGTGGASAARCLGGSLMLFSLLGELLVRVQHVRETGTLLIPTFDAFEISGITVSTLFGIGVAGCVVGIVRRCHKTLFNLSAVAPAIALLVALWAITQPPQPTFDASMVRMLAASAMAFWIAGLAVLGHVWLFAQDRFRGMSNKDRTLPRRRDDRS